MGLTWPIVFGILFVGFVLIPGIVFLSHRYQNQKKNRIKK